MGFWHSFGTGAPGRGQGLICIERSIRRHDGLILSCPPRRENRSRRVPKGIEVRGPGFPLRIARHSPAVDSKFVWIYNGPGISFMQVSKWGNSLAVRLPAVVVEALDLKEGDEIEISIAGKRDFKVGRDRSKKRALEQLREMKWSFPPDFKFNREEINER
jgi:antitoxin MazE